MQTRKFGWTGIGIPGIGQGTWQIEGSAEQENRAVETLRLGLDLGMTHIDTAEMYGNGRAEELVAKAISGRRDEVFLASKVLPQNASYEGTLAACERSLRRLQTNRLDLYMLHWPGNHPVRETMRAMEKLVADRLVRFIGVSNFDVLELQAVEAALRNERLACNQVLYHLGDRGIERRLIPYCASREIAVVAYSPFGQHRFPATRTSGGRVLAEIAARENRTARQVALNFLTRDPNVFTIPKTTHPERARENAGGAGWRLAPEEISAIEKAFPAPDHDTPLSML
ncbi:MAG TPA: aldo/keto reductase [Candidatus Acidoferrales bacterium]|nr:aldo/keto reductase [Candidatus Acidoferrales bacterium]